MKSGYRKYLPFTPLSRPNRVWPDRRIDKAPTWCSVDLRDGNQALVNPMNIEEKLRFFSCLCDIGVKEIEVGFPSASEVEYDFLRALIEGGHIPPDVTIQVLVQAREHLIRRTFDAIRGAKNVIFHFYNSTSALQRKVVFHTDVEGVKKIAVDAAVLIRNMSQEAITSGMNLRYEYSPESFMGTEIPVAAEICAAVMEALGADREHKVILNLPSTVENCMPNYFADEIEEFISLLPKRECAVISLHPHNDRGEGVATAEMGILAGAERVEATLFGNGERTGNVDMVTLALNLWTQGVDPELDFSDINAVRTVYEECTGMKVGPRVPYAGELVFTAFSGSHQDAINKGTVYMRENGGEYWEIPYLPIDPADVGREYEPVVRINSQSGKGGAAFVMQQSFGYEIPKAMQGEFGRMVQEESERTGRELTPDRIMEIFRTNYIDQTEPYRLLRQNFLDSVNAEGKNTVTFVGTLQHKDTVFDVRGAGNGPIDAFFNAIHGQKMDHFTFVDYREHAVGQGSDSAAVAYIHLRDEKGRDVFGVGVDKNINLAPLKGILSAVNRSVKEAERGK